jgi:DNA polymerase-3 subunit epsilon
MLQVTLVDTDDIFFGHDDQLLGLFTSKRKARDVLRAIADQNALCWVALGLEKQKVAKACFASQVGKCLGVCCERESIDEHNARIEAAFAGLRLRAWPYSGAVGLRENGVVHVVDCWSYLGSAPDDDGALALARRGRQRFDRDVYRILQKWLKGSKVGIVDFDAMMNAAPAMPD